jgi:cation/acetate symporter
MGALFSIYGGLAICIVLIIFSPAVSGKPVNPATGRSASMIQGADFHWFPLDNPGLVSIPVSFLLGIIGTYIGGRRPAEEGKFAEMEVRAITGAGAEKATAH